MKKIFIIAVTFGTAINFCFAQTKIEKYCAVTYIPVIAAKVKISVNFGNPNMYIKDSSIMKSLMAINSFKNEIDVLDYMSRNGWSLISILPWGQFNFGRTFYFKKEFDKSVFTIDSN
ncbi:MAG TPA: hypothetical protein VKT28_19925 [Puia sp.]|nr:hypothetical protein [Puia sp.]